LSVDPNELRSIGILREEQSKFVGRGDGFVELGPLLDVWLWSGLEEGGELVTKKLVKWSILLLAVNGAISCRLAFAALVGCSLAADGALVQDYLEQQSVFAVQRIILEIFCAVGGLE
jgi:hypothetical protein